MALQPPETVKFFCCCAATGATTARWGSCDGWSARLRMGFLCRIMPKNKYTRSTETPQLPFHEPFKPPDMDHKALRRGPLACSGMSKSYMRPGVCFFGGVEFLRCLRVCGRGFSDRRRDSGSKQASALYGWGGNWSLTRVVVLKEMQSSAWDWSDADGAARELAAYCVRPLRWTWAPSPGL